MKIRNGFVSNSSSSSFLVAVKTGDLNSALNSLNKKMKSALKGFPFFSVIDDLFGTINNLAKEIDVNEVIRKDYLGDADEYWSSHGGIKKLLQKGYKLYEIEVSSDGEGDMSTYLYEHYDNIGYKSKDGNIIISDLYGD